MNENMRIIMQYNVQRQAWFRKYFAVKKYDEDSSSWRSTDFLLHFLVCDRKWAVAREELLAGSQEIFIFLFCFVLFLD